MLKVLKENGDAVRQGDLLVQLDDTAIRDALASADAASRSASQAFEQAERQLERMKTLRSPGMTSAQALDDAEGRRNGAQSDLEAAKARVVLARQQLQRTEVRAPFDGVVSERKVSPGDTAQVGKELLKVIDPTSMRFEAMVSADHVGERQGRAGRALPRERLRRPGIRGQGAAREPRGQRDDAPGRGAGRLRRRQAAEARRASMPRAASRPRARRASRSPRPRWCATATRRPPGA